MSGTKPWGLPETETLEGIKNPPSKSGTALGADLESEHTAIPALEMAVAHRKAQEGLLFHSDRGTQYGAEAFRTRLGERCPTVRQSMSRTGNCSGLCVRRIFFQTPQRGTGNAGGQACGGRGQRLGVYVS
jgi:hypothetical protein